MYDHLIFYDGQCGLCDRVVHCVLKADTKHTFAFAPLQGTKAKELLQRLPMEERSADSMILIENFRSVNERHIYIRSKAVFRTCWLLGGAWRLIGWKFFLPAWLFDWGYRLVAANRHRLFKPVACVLSSPEDKERFLP